MRPLNLAALAVLLVTPVTNADERSAGKAGVAETSKSDGPSGGSKRSIAEQYAQIRAEYEAEQAALHQHAPKAKDLGHKGAVARKRPRDRVVDYSRRMVDLAESSPADPGAREALLWVINHPGRAYWGEFGDEFARAGTLLVRHHGDDPEAVRIGLTLYPQVTPRCDAILLGFYAAAKGREAKGLARLALAQYLAEKADRVVYARSLEGRPKHRRLRGGKVVSEFDLMDEEYAYLLELRQCDPQVIRAEAVRLFEEVISEYGAVPYDPRPSGEGGRRPGEGAARSRAVDPIF